MKCRTCKGKGIIERQDDSDATYCTLCPDCKKGREDIISFKSRDEKWPTPDPSEIDTFAYFEKKRG